MSLSTGNIPHSEYGLTVFISSRQSPEMMAARGEADRAIDEFPLTRPWAFENMPASSEASREHYLRYASEADFVIWLVGEETSAAVVDEIHACMGVQGRLLVFLLPSTSRDESTSKLLNEVSKYTTWHEVESLDTLGDHIRAALHDETIRAVRNPVLPGRIPQLKRQLAESISRSKRSWTSLGVPEDIADELARDNSVGHVLSLPSGGINMVSGDQGVGKTLALQRFHQVAIDKALKDSSQPYPIFVKARDIDGPLGDYVERMAGNFTFPAVQPVLVLVDGLDEIGTDSARRLLDDAVPYVEGYENMSMAFTTRPLPGIEAAGQWVDVPHLDEGGILSLVSRVAGRIVTVGEMWGWSESVRDAAKRPLFAVMIGAELGKGSDFPAARPTDLVDRLADRALSDAESQSDEVNFLLQTLAVKGMVSGESIPRSEVSPNRSRQNLLLSSRLVTEEDGRFDFTLPIFREWFAARALVEGTVTLEEILPLTERWVVPLTIAVNAADESVGNLLMGTLARMDPGMAGLVLEECKDVRDWDTDESSSLGTAEDIGGQVRQAMEDWGTGIGELMLEIGPVTANGSISTLGIGVSDSWITTSWYRGTEEMPSLVSIPKRDDSLSHMRNWPVVRATSVLPERVWPWVITKEELADTLSQRLASRRLALVSNDAIRELAYDFACSVGRQQWPRASEITIGEALDFIDSHIERGTVSLGVGNTMYKSAELRMVRGHMADLAASGEQFISDPWPSADRVRPLNRKSWLLYEQYTEQRLLERTRAVYGAALSIYADMVHAWFQPFANRLRFNKLLPVKLMGRLAVPQQEDEYTRTDGRPEEPILVWWPQPIDVGQESQVAFEIDPGTLASREDARRLNDSARTASHARSGEHFSGMTVLDVFDSRSATEMAQQWLIRELGRIGWTDLIR